MQLQNSFDELVWFEEWLVGEGVAAVCRGGSNEEAGGVIGYRADELLGTVRPRQDIRRTPSNTYFPYLPIHFPRRIRAPTWICRAAEEGLPVGQSV